MARTVKSTEVLVIGGGTTGAGIARDAAMRGFDVVLVDRKDLAEGTSGRFHGLLHSGARYAVKDPPSARECMEENQVLRAIAADCIEDSGGFFVLTPDDDESYVEPFEAGCLAAGIPAQEISVPEALRAEPRLNPKVRRVFSVPDGAIDAWKTVWACARSTEELGGRVLTYHRVNGLVTHSGAVVGARLTDERSGEQVEIHADFVINAAGAWAGQIAALAGCREVEVLPGKGIMIAMNHRVVDTVINRLAMPADGDILVPIRTVSVIGTTDERVADPDDLPVTREEIDQMLDDGERLVPGFRSLRALRVWAGVRPLFQRDSTGTARTRDVSRSHALIDHTERDGLDGFLTITGGKLTTFRRMAEEAVDAMCGKLEVRRACRTSSEPLPDSEDRRFYWLGARLSAREQSLHDEQLICECELITKSRLVDAFRSRPTTNLDDIRRRLRLGMGPCQGGFCIYRATSIMHSLEHVDRHTANAALLHFLQERWKGVHPILYGDQFRQARLDDWIFQGLLDVEHLP